MKLARITTNPNRMNGQPCIRNLRLTVRRTLEIVADLGMSSAHIPQVYQRKNQLTL